ncbi:MAG: 30S ribosomal protein S27ae [Candidatus Aenigmarchaeota archaeon]|nr:30S ribosomal protein S27ae [Candidatus Aenigmarchaeota archaeon]
MAKAPAPKKEAPAPAAPAKGGKPAPAAEPAPAPKEKKEKKSQKERPKSKKKHTKVQVWKLYDVKGGALTRKNQACPRCGPGTFLASYKNRKYCGKCGFAEIQKV